MIEAWKPLQGGYFISNWGRVKSTRNRGRPADLPLEEDFYKGLRMHHLLTPYAHGTSSHYGALIRVEGVTTWIPIAKTVLELFAPAPPVKSRVAYRDHNRHNLRIDNLFWEPMKLPPFSKEFWPNLAEIKQNLMSEEKS